MALSIFSAVIEGLVTNIETKDARAVPSYVPQWVYDDPGFLSTIYSTTPGTLAARWSSYCASEFRDSRCKVWDQIVARAMATADDANAQGAASRALLMQIMAAPGQTRPGPSGIIAQPIAGAGQFTAPVGSPIMEPRAFLMDEPRNQITPASGRPGGSFNYNTLLQSALRPDVEVTTESAGPLVASTNVLSLTLPNPAGIWIFEIEISHSHAGSLRFSFAISTMNGGNPFSRIIFNQSHPWHGQFLRLVALPVGVVNPVTFNVICLDATIGGETVETYGKGKLLSSF